MASRGEHIVRIAEQFCTLSEAAAYLGVNRITIRRWIQAGKIEAQTAGGVVFIERLVVEGLKKNGE